MEELIKEVERDMDEILRGDGEKLVENAKKIGEQISKGVTTSQIRNIYSEVVGMREFDKYKLQLLRAKLAYIAGKEGTIHKGKLTDIGGLQKILDGMIRKVNDEKYFENFKNFFEAILAYHKYYGGKD